MVAVPKVLYNAIKHCAFIEGRSMANFIATTLWNYMAQTHGVKTEAGLLNYGKKRADPRSEVEKEIDTTLGELLKEDDNVGGSD